jgi:hypothetical protein
MPDLLPGIEYFLSQQFKVDVARFSFLQNRFWDRPLCCQDSTLAYISSLL